MTKSLIHKCRFFLKLLKLCVEPVHTWSHYTKIIINDLTLSNIQGSSAIATNKWMAVRIVETLFVVAPTGCGSLYGAHVFKIVREYDQEIPQSQTADKPMVF